MKKKTENKPEVRIICHMHLQIGTTKEKLPYAKTWHEALVLMAENLGQPIELPTSIGKRLGLQEKMDDARMILTRKGDSLKD